MRKEVGTIVISVGGSLIIPDQIDVKFLDRLKKTLAKFTTNYKFVLVCGGGSIARKYIQALQAEHASEGQMAIAGTRATRMNAGFVIQFFNPIANKSLPMDMQDVSNQLQKNRIVICGALRFTPDATSDSTAARLAYFLHAKFINLTNVPGLFDKDPNKHKNAKLIRNITWQDFEKTAIAIPYHPGQHFVLDQKAATTIREHKIPTFILGKDLNNLERFLKNKGFTGTTIAG